MANKKSRPAKDIKPTDLRAKALQEAKTNKTKALASEMQKKASAQAASKKVGPAKDLNKGGARAKFLKDAKSGKIKASSPKVINKGLPTAAASRLMKLGSTAAVAATFYLGDTFSTKTGGAAQAPAPKKGEKPSPYAVTGTGRLRPEVKKIETKKNIVGNNPNRNIGTSKSKSSSVGILTGVAGGKGALAINLKVDPYFGGVLKRSGMTGNGRLRPEVKKSKSAIEEAYTLGNGAQGKAPPTTSTSAQAPKAAVAKKPAFKGNWAGAAATEMQKRGGAKIKRPNLLSLFRKKK